MDLIQKALWFVENHSREEISLEKIAEACQVSSYHLTRAFSTETGFSLMKYVKVRRLTEAAKCLIQNKRDILSLAMEFGYNSQEAFTRAFKDQFHLTPGVVRTKEDLEKLNLIEAFTMKSSPTPKLTEPKIVELKSKQFIGLKENYDCNAPAGIPDQWQKFSQYIGHIEGQIDFDAFGICYNFDKQNRFDYLTCVEVSSQKNAKAPANLIYFDLKPNTYAVFAHAGHVSEIRAVFAAIWNQWFLNSKFKSIETPNLEKYGKNFDAKTGNGGFEIWIPIER